MSFSLLVLYSGKKSDEKYQSRLHCSDESSVIVCYQLSSRQQLSRSFCHRCHRSYRSYRIIAGPHLHPLPWKLHVLKLNLIRVRRLCVLNLQIFVTWNIILLSSSWTYPINSNRFRCKVFLSSAHSVRIGALSPRNVYFSINFSRVCQHHCHSSSTVRYIHTLGGIIQTNGCKWTR